MNWAVVKQRVPLVGPEYPADAEPTFCENIGVRAGDRIVWVLTAYPDTPQEAIDRAVAMCAVMAAAPELLEAAKAALARLTADCLNGCGILPGNELCSEVACPRLADIQRLEAAVAKAEGRDEK